MEGLLSTGPTLSSLRQHRLFVTETDRLGPIQIVCVHPLPHPSSDIVLQKGSFSCDRFLTNSQNVKVLSLFIFQVNL